MARHPPFAARPLDPFDGAEALALAAAAGAHGTYVRNALLAEEGDSVALHGADRLLGLCWFGPRGNLIVLQAEALDGGAVADAVRQSRIPWRIAMGPGEAVDALADRCAGRPLVHRNQVYYSATATDAAEELRRAEVRPASKADMGTLVEAALLLNEADLLVDPRRVDRRWLLDTVRGRIADGSTRVLAEADRVQSKLDFGSSGAGGLVLEGVFTFPAVRGRGLAAALVATVLGTAGSSTVCLHVAEDNGPARHAYQRAGMGMAGSCRLLLLG